MLQKCISVGDRYIARVGCRDAAVRVLAIHVDREGRKHFDVVVEATGQGMTFRTSAKFLRSALDRSALDRTEPDNNKILEDYQLFEFEIELIAGTNAVRLEFLARSYQQAWLIAAAEAATCNPQARAIRYKGVK